MATSNRDRVGQMFEVLTPALHVFITGVLQNDLKGGSDWTKLVELKDTRAGVTGRKYSPLDPQLSLRMLTEKIPHQVRPGWYPFDGHLSRQQESYASELREVRNAWAHGDAFNDDDAYRALDTAERLLRSLAAAGPADELGAIRRGLRRVTADKDDQRALRSASVSAASAGLPPWRDVLPPHEDVATGNFQAAEFAADLYKVATGSTESGRDYADPVEFFRRTYLTEGLRDLIGRAVRRLSGDGNASPVVNLQTNFGGGKTHSMLALWHLADGRPIAEFPQDAAELLAASGYDRVPSPVHRVAIVGNHFAPSGETKADGTVVRTMWGELAWQLGGPEGYALVADADSSSTPPGSALHRLLARYAPAVILIDEWVAYARSLFGREGVAGGTFDDQFTFAQALTEAARGTSGVLVAISIPASSGGPDGESVGGSTEEVGGAFGLEALKRLQNVVRRVADQWRPASADEAYHIVRRRLFVAPDAAALAVIGQTARAFGEYYRKNADDFPREARDPAYEERIKRTFPIHPELFDCLNNEWSTLERFQRTRGVLRLMNAVIHGLWVGEDASPMIMPGSIPLATASVNAELTQYLQDSWKAVIDADVDGPNSEPAKIDAAKTVFGQRSLTKRLARTVFFGAAPTIGSAHKGMERQRVFLGVAVPGDVVGNFHSALTALGDRATHFYSGSGKYWYDVQANISRRAKDQAERLHKEDVWAEIVRRLRDEARHPADFMRVHVCPEDSADIPDVDEARLVILPPLATHKRGEQQSGAIGWARKATETRGTANRVNANMLVYLAADHDRMAEVDAAVRDYLGWNFVFENSAELDLTANQKNQAAEKRRQADDTAMARLLGAYHWALVPTTLEAGEPFTIDVTRAEGQAPHLPERVSRRLGNNGVLNTRQAAANIRLALERIPQLWSSGHVSVGDLWKVYAAYNYMPRLRDQSVLTKGLTDQPLLWQREGFALAERYEGERYVGLWLPREGASIAINDSVLLVKPELALVQRGAEATAEAQGGYESARGHGPPSGAAATPASGIGETTSEQPLKRRFFGVKELSSEKYGTEFKKVADEILVHLVGDPATSVRLRLEIEAENSEGFDDAQVRTVSENASELKFEDASFEES